VSGKVASTLATLVLAALALAGPRAVRAEDHDRWATLAQPQFRTYGQDDGLPNPVATAIGEDGDGFLWVGTEGGLSRWDGYRFRTYLPAAGEPGALPDGWVTALHADLRGRLWVGTSAGGLAMYDRDDDRFVTHGPAQGLSDVHVSAIADDGPDGLWVATEHGLNRLDVATGAVVSSHHVEGDAGSLPDDRVISLLVDRDGALWVGTRAGLARRPRGGDRFQPVTPDGGDVLAAGSLAEDADGRVWIGTTRRGAFTVEAGQAAPRPVGEAPGPSALERQWVFAMTQAGPHEMWLGTFGQGIVSVDTDTGRTRRLQHDALVRQSLPADGIGALHRDRAGGLWVATDAGLSRLASPPDGAALTIFGETSNPAGLTQADVLSVTAASDGHVWVGLRTEGIDVLDPVRGRVFGIRPDPEAPETALPPTLIRSILEWDGDGMYVGTNAGLYHVDLSGGGVRRLTVPGRDPAARTPAVFKADGRLWVAGPDDGVWSMSPGAGPGAAVEHLDAGRLTDRRATCFVADGAGDLWIGTRHGLNRLDLAARTVERILPDPTVPGAMASGYVGGMAIDHAGRLWVGTMGGGVQVLTGRERGDQAGDQAGRPVFARIGVREGLPDDNVDSLLVDVGGRIWASTDGGLAVIEPDSLAVHALRRAEGVAFSTHWVGSGAMLAPDELAFGAIGGLTVIRPDRFRPWTWQPPVVMTEIRLGGRPEPAGRFNGPAAGAAAEAGGAARLTVRPDANSVAVEFAALDFSASDRNRYAYRLEGYDAEWVETDPSRRLAAYTNLPPGAYTLHMRGSNREGAWSSAALDLPITVLPAWYQTAWSKALAAALAGAAAFGLVQARTALLRRRQRELEQLVAERTAELEESNRQIEQIAYHDALTGLPNRRLFTEDLRKLVAPCNASHDRFALLLIDLDRFKQVNDTLGHDAGDALLVEAAARMRAALRASDRLARLGGDEFAILITDLGGTPASDAEAVDAVCARLVDVFARTIAFKSAEMRTSASIGVTLCAAGGNNPDELYKEADLALYEAKRSGRDTWRWHGATSREAAPAK
jgi:diguanylate cyclase (GGDEF)-like protein